MSNKKRKLFAIAAKIANSSTYHKHHHGAILIKGGKIVNTSCNKSQHCEFAERFRDEPGYGTIHAELGCILGLPRKLTIGTSILVVRVSQDGNWKLSKPCSMCEKCLKYVGVIRVLYSVDNHLYGMLNLRRK
jgi:deoxycytidylate deaminase